MVDCRVCSRFLFVSILLLFLCIFFLFFFFFFKQKTAYEMRISDWSSGVCSSDLVQQCGDPAGRTAACRSVARTVSAEHGYQCNRHVPVHEVPDPCDDRARDEGIDRQHRIRRWRGRRADARRICRREACGGRADPRGGGRLWQARHSRRSEEHTSELQSLMRISSAVFCLKKKKNKNTKRTN